MDKWIKKQQTLFELDHDLDSSNRVLRPSSISQFIRCPYQWYLTTLKGRKQRPAAASTAGTSIHAGAEYGFKQKIVLGNLPQQSEVVEVAVAEWDALNEKLELDYKSDESKDKYTDDIAKGMSIYYEEVMNDLEPVAVERRYSIDLDHSHFTHLSGTLDIVLEDAICDIKFTKSVRNPMHYTIQQNTYGLLREANGEEVKDLYIHNVIRPGKTARTPAKLEIGTIPNQSDYAKFWIGQILDTVDQYNNSHNELLFRGCSPDSNYLCSAGWCGFWSECPYVAGYRASALIKEEEFDI